MLLQVVVMVLLLQSQLILLVLLVLLLHELLMLTKVKVERAVHAELVFDDFVDVTIFEAALQRIQIEIQIVWHQAGHDAVVVQHTHEVAHDLRWRRRRRLRFVLADVLGRTRTVAGAVVTLC